MRTEEEIRKFAREVYGSTTYSHKMKLIAYNDDYILMQKPPSTEYIGRMSPSVYSASEWFLIPFMESTQDLRYRPQSESVFYKEGKLSKEDKELLKTTFWVILYKQNEFWGTYQKGFFKFYKLLKETDTSIVIQENTGNERTLSKNKYRIAYFNDDKEALNSFLKLERLAEEHTAIHTKMGEKAKEIGKVFSDNETTEKLSK